MFNRANGPDNRDNGNPPAPPVSPARGASPQDPFGGGGFDLSSLLNLLYVVRERWITGLVAGLAVAGLFAFFALKEIPVYESTGHFLIEPRADRVVNIEQVVDTGISGQMEVAMENHLRQLRTRDFRSAVVETFDERERERIVRPYRDEEGHAPSVGAVVGQSVRIHRDRRSVIFSVTARHRDAEVAALIANRFIGEYINRLLMRTGTGNEAAIVFLRRQADELRDRIETAERELQDYRTRYNLVSLEENQNVIVERLKQIDGALTGAMVELQGINAQISQVEEVRAAGGDLSEVPPIARFGTVGEIRQRLNDQERQHAQLDLRYLRMHPRMIESTERLDSLNRQLEREINRAVRDLEMRQAELVRREANLSTQLARAEADALELDRRAIEYNVLRRKLTSEQRTFDEIVSRLNETIVASQLENTNLRILDSAVAGGAPVSPDRKRIFMVTALLLLVGFFGVPLLIEFFDNRLTSVMDVEDFVGKPLLADLHAATKTEAGERPKIVLKSSDEMMVEAYRGAYAALRIHGHEQYPKVIAVTSALPKEGKSFFTSNFGSVCALHGMRTLIVDADFRRPSQSKNFDLKNDRGVLTWHASKEPVFLGDAASPKAPYGVHELAENLYLMCSGGATKRSTEVLECERFGDLMEHLRKQFDVVIIDTPPVSRFPDALFAARFADETIFVCKHNVVSRHKVKQSVRALENTLTPVVGIVINNRKSSRGSHGGYGYYSKYGYSYRYDYKNYREYQKYYSTADKS